MTTDLGLPWAARCARRAGRTREASSNPALYDQEAVRGLFDRMSDSYDRMNLVMSLGFSALWRRQALALVAGAPGPRRVLDLMSGRGETWAEIARTFPGASIVAIDFSEQMIAQSDRRNTARHDGAVSIRHEDALQSSLPDGSIDVIVSAFGLKTFDADQSARLAGEVARLLRPGGSFVFIDVTQPPNRVLRLAYTLYVRCVVPVAGILLLSDPVEYRMLHRYLTAYGDGARSVEAFAGERDLVLETRTHFFGCATSLHGHRTGGDDR